MLTVPTTVAVRPVETRLSLAFSSMQNIRQGKGSVHGSRQNTADRAGFGSSGSQTGISNFPSYGYWPLSISKPRSHKCYRRLAIHESSLQCLLSACIYCPVPSVRCLFALQTSIPPMQMGDRIRNSSTPPVIFIVPAPFIYHQTRNRVREYILPTGKTQSTDETSPRKITVGSEKM